MIANGDKEKLKTPYCILYRGCGTIVSPIFGYIAIISPQKVIVNLTMRLPIERKRLFIYKIIVCENPMLWLSIMHSPTTTTTSNPPAMSLGYCTRMLMKIFSTSAIRKSTITKK